MRAEAITERSVTLLPEPGDRPESFVAAALSFARLSGLRLGHEDGSDMSWSLEWIAERAEGMARRLLGETARPASEAHRVSIGGLAMTLDEVGLRVSAPDAPEGVDPEALIAEAGISVKARVSDDG